MRDYRKAFSDGEKKISDNSVIDAEMSHLYKVATS